MAFKISDILPHLQVLLLAVVVAFILGALSEVPGMLMDLLSSLLARLR
jgi:hypothetical protein